MFCWRLGFHFKILWSSQNIIHLEVENGGDDPNFLCSLVHRLSVWREKEIFWCELKNLNHNENMPWVCLRDFNDILSQKEMQGGRAISSSSSRGLSHFMHTMRFVTWAMWVRSSLGVTNARGLQISESVWIEVFLIYHGALHFRMLLSLIIPSRLRIIPRWFYLCSV